MRDRSFRFCFNPKREAHPLQTRQCRVGDRHHHGVSIPNGKPILFRPMPARCSPLVSRWFQSQTGSPSSSDNRSCLAAARFSCRFQSQTGSPSSSDQAGVYDTRPGHRFQSQTGSPSSSDASSTASWTTGCFSFNPKREAHPLQTRGQRGTCHAPDSVSIPNGKPILFRRRTIWSPAMSRGCFNPKREAHPLQTQHFRLYRPLRAEVSIPNGKPILFRHFIISRVDVDESMFQSQTGSPSSSDWSVSQAVRN